MENIVHNTIKVNSINMHIAEIGEGPAVLFVHGFPELWYSWRHQMLSLSSKGYRAIAPDLRGYGDTDAPPSTTSYTAFHIVGDLVALLDTLGLDKVFVVGHDWGAIISWYLCSFRPDRVKALVNLSVVFNPRNPLRKPIDGLRAAFGDDFYMCRFQKPGFEEEFDRVDTAKLIAAFFTSRDPGPPLLPAESSFAKAIEFLPPTLPSWLTQDDINYYASKFNSKGFAGPINYYRCFDLYEPPLPTHTDLRMNWELTGAWTGSKIEVPVKFIVGDLDLTYHFPGTKDYIHGGGFKKFVPLLEEVVVMEDTGHFINQEKPEEINNHIYDFIQKF